MYIFVYKNFICLFFEGSLIKSRIFKLKRVKASVSLRRAWPELSD